jgi:hypothetical protein
MLCGTYCLLLMLVLFLMIDYFVVVVTFVSCDLLFVTFVVRFVVDSFVVVVGYG